MPVSSLPSPYGIGAFSKEAYEFVDFLAEAGQTYWQMLPLGQTGYGDSPYQSFSTFAGNPYIFCTGEMQETLYDYNAAGEIRTWTLRTTAGDAENAPMRLIGTSGALRIETDAPVQEAVVIGDTK